MRGFVRGGYRQVRLMRTLANDWLLNIETTPHRWSVNRIEPERLFQDQQRSVPVKNGDMGGYYAIDYAVLRRIIQFLEPRPSDTVFDLGAGKGRVVCMFARLRLQRCVGVELSPALAETAMANARRLRGRETPIDIVRQDAAQADLDDGTIYVLFNPFGADTLNEVLTKIERSLAVNPRSLTVVYINDLHRRLLEDRGWLTEIHEMWTPSTRHISFWRNSGAGERTQEVTD